MIKKLTVEQLKYKLAELGLETSGVKAVLVERLEKAIDEQSEVEFESSEENAEEITLQVDKIPFHKASVKMSQNKSADASTPAKKVTSDHSDITEAVGRISVRDVDNLLSKFSGDDNVSIKSWFSEFEDLAMLLKWSEVEKYIFAKKQLTGSARSFIRTCACYSYSSFKVSLCAEFDKPVCKAEIYIKLQSRKMYKNEQFREYVYKMQELGQLADVDDKSLIWFIVNSLPGRRENKLLLLLYDAELKEKF